MRNIDYVIRGFGFENLQDLADSCFHLKYLKSILITSLLLGNIGAIIEMIFGFNWQILVASIGLIIIEFITGILASRKERVKADSRRFGRLIIKMFIYFSIIAVFNAFQKYLPAIEVFGGELNVYTIVFYSIITMVNLQLLMSCAENAVRLGIEEFGMLGKFISNKLNEWFDIDKKRHRTRDEDDYFRDRERSEQNDYPEEDDYHRL